MPAIVKLHYQDAQQGPRNNSPSAAGATPFNAISPYWHCPGWGTSETDAGTMSRLHSPSAGEMAAAQSMMV
jgi:hypothetical protein